MARIRRSIVVSLILARPPEADKLRGFCLLISEEHAFGISAKKSARILYPALYCFDLAELYELCGLIPDIVRDIFIRGFSDKIPDLLRQEHRVCYFAMVFQHAGH